MKVIAMLLLIENFIVDSVLYFKARIEFLTILFLSCIIFDFLLIVSTFSIIELNQNNKKTTQDYKTNNVIINVNNHVIPRTKELITVKRQKTKPKMQIIEKEDTYDYLDCLVTAYCPCAECSEGYGHQTSTGAIAIEGRTIAVDPDVISYGSEVIIDGKTYIAEDCGGRINGSHIDIFFENHEDVDNFGKKYMKVRIKK